MTAGKLTIGVLPISYICQSFSTWTVVAVALDRLVSYFHTLLYHGLLKQLTWFLKSCL